MVERPGVPSAKKPLHFFWILDCSGSMRVAGKMESLNNTIKEALPEMKKVALESHNADVFVRVLTFSSGAQWQMANPVPIDKFNWTDIKAGGMTDMGKAISMVADQLRILPITDRALPPLLVLVTDGYPTDNFSQGLKSLMDQKWGERSVRMAIGLGENLRTDVLEKFIGNPEIDVLYAQNPQQLAQNIRFISTRVLEAASNLPSQPKNPNGENIEGIAFIPKMDSDIVDSNEMIDNVW